MEDKKQSYKDLIVWQKSMQVVKLVYQVTSRFPENEKFGLVSQMRRCSVSIPSNIAEGRYRSTKKDYCQFLSVAFASGAELETQLEVALMLNFINQPQKEQVGFVLTEVMKMLNVMIAKLRI
jgi:four helix bundle protein